MGHPGRARTRQCRGRGRRRPGTTARARTERARPGRGTPRSAPLLRATSGPGLPVNGVVTAIGLVWVTLLLVAGGLVLLRARDAFQRLVALDALSVLVVGLLALLSYARDEPYYIDAAVALSLLSLVASVAAARYLGSGRPFE